MARGVELDDEPTTATTWGRGPVGGWGAPPAGRGRPEAATVSLVARVSPAALVSPAAWGSPMAPVPAPARASAVAGPRPLPWAPPVPPPPLTAAPAARPAVRRHAAGPPRSPWPPEPVRRPVLLRWAVLVAVLGAAAVLAFGAPGLLVTRVFDDAALARGVGQVLVTDYALDATSVRCPAGVRVVAGRTFTCAATIAGREVGVPVRIVSRSGAYEVGRPA